MTEGLDHYAIARTWYSETRDQYASVDNSTIRHIEGEVFYSISGELLADLLTMAGFEPVEER